MLISNLFLLLIPLLFIIFLVTTYFSHIILKDKENSNYYITQTVATQVSNKVKI